MDKLEQQADQFGAKLRMIGLLTLLEGALDGFLHTAAVPRPDDAPQPTAEERELVAEYIRRKFRLEPKADTVDFAINTPFRPSLDVIREKIAAMEPFAAPTPETPKITPEDTTVARPAEPPPADPVAEVESGNQMGEDTDEDLEVDVTVVVHDIPVRIMLHTGTAAKVVLRYHDSIKRGWIGAAVFKRHHAWSAAAEAACAGLVKQGFPHDCVCLDTDVAMVVDEFEQDLAAKN